MSLGTSFPFDRLRKTRFSPSFDGNSISNADRIVTVQYGDGYAQYIRDGENWKKHKFSYSWKNLDFQDFADVPAFTVPQNGDCTNLTNIPDGNILFQFLETVRTNKPFNFTIPYLNQIVQVRVTEYEMKIAQFAHCDLTVKFETDYSLN